MKVYVCCIAKMENRYIREWVEHYKSIGFDKAVIVDNNDRDGERFDEVIQDYIDSGFVEIIDFRGRIQAQIDAYNYVYYNVGGADWIAFFDVDEYLTLEVHKDVKEFISSFDTNNTDVIKINWMCYGDGGLVHYEDKPLNERFTVPFPIDTLCDYNFPLDYHVKPIVKCGLMSKSLRYYVNPHVPVGINLKYRNAVGADASPQFYEPFDFSVAYLKHFGTKTIEEYTTIKMVRGIPDRSPADSRKTLTVNEFFRYNERTEEKMKIANDILRNAR